MPFFSPLLFPIRYWPLSWADQAEGVLSISQHSAGVLQHWQRCYRRRVYLPAPILLLKSKDKQTSENKVSFCSTLVLHILAYYLDVKIASHSVICFLLGLNSSRRTKCSNMLCCCYVAYIWSQASFPLQQNSLKRNAIFPQYTDMLGTKHYYTLVIYWWKTVKENC